MVITLGHSSNLRRRSGEHFLKSPQRLLPLMLFFSKKVKWVHLGMVVLVWENYTPGYQLPPTPTPPKLLKNRQILTWGWRNTVAGTFPWWPHPPGSSQIVMYTTINSKQIKIHFSSAFPPWCAACWSSLCRRPFIILKTFPDIFQLC